MNVVCLVGRIVSDPEVKLTQGNIQVCSFRIAVDRRYKDANGQKMTDFIDCVAWRQQADFLQRFVGKGRLLAVQGTLQVRNWQTQDGQPRRSVEVVVDSIQALDKQKDTMVGNTIPSVAPPDPFAPTEGIPDWSNSQGSNSQGYNNGLKNDVDYDPFDDE